MFCVLTNFDRAHNFHPFNEALCPLNLEIYRLVSIIFEILSLKRCLELIEKQSTCLRDADYSNDRHLAESDLSEDGSSQRHSTQKNIRNGPSILPCNQLNLFDGSISLSLGKIGTRVSEDVSYTGEYNTLKSARSSSDERYSQKQFKKVKVSDFDIDEPDLEITSKLAYSDSNDDCLDVGLFIDDAKLK